jgi:hypothetical protein
MKIEDGMLLITWAIRARLEDANTWKELSLSTDFESESQAS